MYGIRNHSTVESHFSITGGKLGWFGGLILALSVFNFSVLFGQPKWVKQAIKQIDKSPILEIGANKVVWEEIDYQVKPGPKSIKNVKRVIKIANESDGLESFKWYFSSNMWIERFKGWICYPNGKVKKLKKKHLIEQASIDMDGEYSDDRVFRIDFGQTLGAGTYIAFEYRVIETGFFANVIVFDEPLDYDGIVWSKLRLAIPEGGQVKEAISDRRYFSAIARISSERHVINFSDTSILPDLLNYRPGEPKYDRVWVIKNLLPIDSDLPYLPPIRYLRPFVILTVYDPNDSLLQRCVSWANLAKWIGEEYSSVCVPDSNVLSFAHILTDTCRSLREKIEAIAKFVQRKVRYVAIELGKGKYVPRPPGTVLKRRYGDCKDKAILMVALLQAIGIRSFPVLCHTESPILANVPTMVQFNHLIVAVDTCHVSENGNVDCLVYFDPTNSTLRFGEIPNYLQDNYVLLIRSRGPYLVKIPQLHKKGDFAKFFIQGNVDSSGSVNISMRAIFGITSDFEYSKYKKRNHKGAWKSFLKRRFPNKIVNLDSLQWKVHRDSIIYTVRFTVKSYVEWIGDFGVFQIHPFAEEKRVYSEDYPSLRSFPFYVESDLFEEHTICWSLPNDWLVNVKQDSIEISSSANSVSYKLWSNGANIFLNHTYKEVAGIFEPDGYGQFIESKKINQEIGNKKAIVRKSGKK